jgi:phospholipase C
MGLPPAALRWYGNAPAPPGEPPPAQAARAAPASIKTSSPPETRMAESSVDGSGPPLRKGLAMKSPRGFLLIAAAAIAALAGCGRAATAVPSAVSASRLPNEAKSTSPIKHVVILIQENRSFNNLFATYPGADGTTVANVAAESACKPPIKAGTLHLEKTSLVLPHDLNHRYIGFSTAFNGGKMDSFDRVKLQDGKPECRLPYVYTDPAQIRPYWTMARQYVLAEHMFTTHGSGSFIAHQDLIRGSTQIDSGNSLIDNPTGEPWGCDAKSGAKTSLITAGDAVKRAAGPFPCTSDFPSSDSYNTLRDLLDGKSVSWKYYVPKLGTNYGNLMNAFDVIAPVRYGPEWTANVTWPQTEIFNDISDGSLPAVSWVVPSEPDSDHPGEKVDHGPAWIASIVNAIGESRYWGSTAIVVVWDDWGGLYDNAPPKQYRFGELGFRVPALIVSPYARAGHISKTHYEFASILRYVENNWKLGSLRSLGTTDKRAASLIDCFNYKQQPIQFQPISSEQNKEFFMREKPSGPPDDDF